MIKTKFNKAQLIEWWDKAPEPVRAATYFENQLECKGAWLWLCVNTKPTPRTVARISRKAFNWFETKPLKRVYLNIQWYSVIKKLTPPSSMGETK